MQVYLNGQFVPMHEATLSVMDRGFLFADGVYEVVPVFSGHLFAFKAHIDRLYRSLDGIGISPVLSHAEWEAIAQQLLSELDDPLANHMFYLQVTRGAYPMRSHDIPSDCQPTVFAYCQPVSAKEYHQTSGFKAITLPDSRRYDCWIKAIALLPNVMLNDQARQQQATEAILIRDGKVTEGTTSNFFMVKDQTVLTPKLAPTLLGGVTRDIVLQLTKQLNIESHEVEIDESELYDADEIWMTGSIKEICPITKLNDQSVGNGQLGPVWHKVYQAFNEYKIHG